MQAYVSDRSDATGMRLTEVPDPAVFAPSDAVVEVTATALNRGEVAQLHTRPDGMVLGWDLAGVVAVAAADGSGPPVGTSVFGWSPDGGAWAERVSVSTRTLEPAPAGLDAPAGAAIGIAGLTALYALRRGGSLLGRTVIITGAAGGVGRCAVQLAALAGASVEAVVGENPERVAAITGLDLPRVEVVHTLAPDGPRVHLVLESVGGDSLSAAFRRVARGGRIVTYGRSAMQPGAVPPEWFYRDARLEGLVVMEDAARDITTPSALAIIGSLIAHGRLDPGVGLVADWPALPDAARALLDRRVPGRAVVRIGSTSPEREGALRA